MRTTPTLLLLNGPPGAGKSTLAAALADDLAASPGDAAAPLPLALDVDTIKHALGRWDQDPSAAGLQARRLALAMADRHLRDGHDVIVGQYLARPEFVRQLSTLAVEAGAEFLHVLLELPASELARRLSARRELPTRPEHATNGPLTDPSDAQQLIDSLADIRRLFPDIHPVDASGSADGTVHALRALLDR